jgi:diguanylate cyclase (GGDEF)-like protein
VDYPQPDEQALREWNNAVMSLGEMLDCVSVRLRTIDAGSLTTLSLYRSGVGSGLDEETLSHRNTLGENLISEHDVLSIADLAADRRWTATEEHHRECGAYLGVRVAWPDGEPFAVLEAIFSTALDDQAAARGSRALENARTAIGLRLELLYRDAQAATEKNRDILTGLANHRLFDEITRHHLEGVKRSGAELWMLRWGIDGHDDLRQRLGKAGADRILRAAAERARACIRRSDVLGRVRQDRFGLLLLDANEFVATAVSDRIKRSTRRVRVDARDLPGLTLSFGISPHTPGESLRAWHQRVEHALTLAREAGGDQSFVLRPPEDPAGEL